MAADTCLTADPGVASSIPAQSHTFVKIYHELISMVILLPSAGSRRVVVSYKLKYVHEVLINCLVKFAKEKSMVRSTDRPDMTIAVDWYIKNKQLLIFNITNMSFNVICENKIPAKISVIWLAVNHSNIAPSGN